MTLLLLLLLRLVVWTRLPGPAVTARAAPLFYIHDFQRPEAVDLYPPKGVKLLPFTNASDLIFSEKYAANEGFGEFDSDTGSFSTWQVALFRNIYSRLIRSPQRTFNSSKASVFFIPYDAGVETYIYRDGTFRGGGNPLAKVITKYLSGSELFQRHGGADHFMVYSASLLSQGIGSKLKRLFRLCENVTFLTFETNTTYEGKKFKGFSLPYLTAVPYPSIIHWYDKVSLRSIPILDEINQPPKRFFASLVASTQTNQPDANRFRRSLMKQCIAMNYNGSEVNYASRVPFKRLCWHHDIGSRDSRNLFDVGQISSVYRRSVFCLMPPGDTKTRRGIFDAILCGCIPVLFEYPYTRNPVHPMEQYHWHFNQEEIKDGFVFFDGSDMNYMQKLANMSGKEITKKNDVLKNLAFRIQYSAPKGASSRELPSVGRVLDQWTTPRDVPGDAVTVILDKMFEKSQKLYCGRV